MKETGDKNGMHAVDNRRLPNRQRHTKIESTSPPSPSGEWDHPHLNEGGEHDRV